MRPEFKREQLKERLLDKNNLPILEDLLNKEIQRRKSLKELKNNGLLDFGLKYSKEELPAVLAQVKADVDEFLGTSQVDMPRTGYFSFLSVEGVIPIYYAYSGVNASFPLEGFLFLATSFLLYSMLSQPHYNPLLRNITLGREKRANIIPIFAHEYTHYIQEKRGFPRINFDHAMIEGHARGIERFIANLYQEREGNSAFLCDVRKRHVEELAQMYRWLCKKHGVQQKELISTQVKNYSIKRINAYSIGTTALYIQEVLQGNKIFREIIEGKFQFANP